MVFLSAQPDEYYFLWQLQLQLYNFSSLGIAANQIHVLVGYKPSKGLNPLFRQFIDTNSQASFFAYPDTRENKVYASSIRPHLIAKHWEAYPVLQQETVFYHDADIVFRATPEWEALLEDEICYASDTRSYLDSHYIVSAAGEKIFNQMCAIVGITADQVKQNDAYAGGAQYILKKTTADFWHKVERDCEKMFATIRPQTQVKGINDNLKSAFDAWCTDMWVVWWNILLSGKRFKIHPLLDFCWATSAVSEWERCNILHYTGGVNLGDKRFFRKADYAFYAPFYCDFQGISPEYCSAPLVKMIDAYRGKFLEDRIDLSDTSFLIPARIDSAERLKNLLIVTQYLSLYFKTNIIVIEADKEQRVDPSQLPLEVEYHFEYDDNQAFHKTRYINQLVKLANTPYIGIYDTDAVVPMPQITESIGLLRNGDYSVVSPYDGAFASVDIMAKFLFSKILDSNYFEVNRGKTGIGVKRSWGGALFLNRMDFIRSGMSNEHFTSWGPEDLEHSKRMEILGYKVKRVKGTLYHLKHPRGVNSGYASPEKYITLMNEYFKICSMSRDELKKYITTWEWSENTPEHINTSTTVLSIHP